MKLEIENQSKALESAKVFFESVENLYTESEIQLTEGRIDYYTFLQSKDAFLSAEAELIQAEYRLVFTELTLKTIFNSH